MDFGDTCTTLRISTTSSNLLHLPVLSQSYNAQIRPTNAPVISLDTERLCGGGELGKLYPQTCRWAMQEIILFFQTLKLAVFKLADLQGTGHPVDQTSGYLIHDGTLHYAVPKKNAASKVTADVRVPHPGLAGGGNIENALPRMLPTSHSFVSSTLCWLSFTV